MLWQILFILLVAYGLYFRWNQRKFRKIYKQIPITLKPVPLLGHVKYLLGNSQKRMEGIKLLGRETVDNCGGISCIKLFQKYAVVVADPMAADIILKNCLEKNEMSFAAHHLLGQGSILAPVSIWRPRRKFIAPIFNHRTLTSFVQVFSKQSSILADKLKIALGNGNWSLFDFISKYAMDSVCETVLGVKINSQSVENHPVPKNFNLFFDLCADRGVKPWLYSDAVYRWHWDYPRFDASSKILQNFVSKIIKSKRESMNALNNNVDEHNKDEETFKIKSMIEMLIEAGGNKGFTNLELQEETLVMLLAGTDTSAVGTSFTALLLAKYPDIQEKVYQEIKEVFGDSDRPVQEDDLLKLKYLEAVAKESLRMYPPGPVVIRTIDKVVTLPSGVTLIPGLTAIIHIWAIHRNKKYWGADADVFRPERFLEGPEIHPCAFIPFSSGPRNCIGSQYAMRSLKTVVTNIIRRYRLVPKQTADGVTEQEELPVSFEVMMRHADNFQIQVEKRIK